MLLLVLDKYKQFAASHETRWIQSHASTSLGLMYLGSIMLVTWTSATIKQQINKFHKSVPHSRELPYQANFLQAWGSLLRATLSSKLWTVPHSRALPYHATFYKPGPRSREPLDQDKFHISVPHSRELPYRADCLQAWASLSKTPFIKQNVNGVSFSSTTISRPFL